MMCKLGPQYTHFRFPIVALSKLVFFSSGTSFASPMTDGEDRHWNPMIKASPYLYMDETEAITPFALKMGDAGYFDLSSLPLNGAAADNALDTWLVTGHDVEVVTDALEQDFDGEFSSDLDRYSTYRG